jgi:DNA-binding IclR family transcriptional regulator
MPCVSPDRKPTATGMATLNALKGVNLTPEEVSSKTGQPLFRVRSGLRELKNAGFVDEDGEKYVLTQNGKSVIS